MDNINIIHILITKLIKSFDNQCDIYCIGGSTTYCDSIKNYTDTWPYLLRELYNKKSKNLLVNGGVGGWSTLQSLIRFFSPFYLHTSSPHFERSMFTLPNATPSDCNPFQLQPVSTATPSKCNPFQLQPRCVSADISAAEWHDVDI